MILRSTDYGPTTECDFEILDRIKVDYVLNWTAIFF